VQAEISICSAAAARAQNSLPKRVLEKYLHQNIIYWTMYLKGSLEQEIWRMLFWLHTTFKHHHTNSERMLRAE
jgi:hypothetical protein